jgi:hypothetical protein
MKRRRTKLKLLLFSLKKQKSQTWFERKKIENHINFDKRANEKKLIEGPNWKNYIWKLELKYYIKNKQNFNKKKWLKKIKTQSSEFEITKKKEEHRVFMRLGERNEGRKKKDRRRYNS